MTEIPRNQIGIKILINVVDENGDAITLTSATNLKIKMRPIVGAGITKTATLEGASSVYFLSADGDLDAVGVWQAQAYYELSGKKLHTLPVDIFTVVEDLD